MDAVFRKMFLVVLLLSSVCMAGSAAVVVRDTWSDGMRTNVPVTSSNAVWYSSHSSSLQARTNSMLGTNITSSRLWIGYFTGVNDGPVELAVGEAIHVMLVFTPTNVATWTGSGTLRGLRIGLFNFADGAARVTADATFNSGTGNGQNVRGYLLNQAFYETIPTTSPMELLVRNNPGSGNLMGTTADYLSLGSGGLQVSNAAGFSSGAEYRLEFLAARPDEGSMVLTTTIVGGGVNLSFSATDTSTNQTHRFDAFAIRPNHATNSADHFNFSEFKVEVVETEISWVPPTIQRHPATQTAIAGHPATLYTVASGTLPLSFQWHLNTNALISGATNSILLLTNVQSSDAGAYSVVVTNVAGAITSAVATLTVTSSPPGALFFQMWASNRVNQYPAGAATSDDPDADGLSNVEEFVWGTDPDMANAPGGFVRLLPGSEEGLFSAELSYREGRRLGVETAMAVSTNLTHWISPWWHRAWSESPNPSFPNAVKEVLTTHLHRANVWFARPHFVAADLGAQPATYYVAVTGNDHASGTNIAEPFATLGRAAALANPGDLIYIRGGTYVHAQRIQLTRSGSPAQPIRVRAFPGERPVFEFYGQPTASTSRGIEVLGHWWELRRLEIAGAGDNGIYLGGNSNIVEQCVTRECRDTGIHIGPGAAHNLVLNCDSYRNFDPPTFGENADGFSAKGGAGPGNVFRGCRAWENSDDGYDFWEALNTVVVEDCWAFRNGIDFWDVGATFQGNANGFKLGGNFFPGPHRVARCLAFLHRGKGFDQNNNTAGLILEQNTAWSNTNRNYAFGGSTTNGVHVLRNNLSINGTVSVHSSAVQVSNSWQVILSPAAGASDVLSTDAALALAPRQADGSLPELPFMRPVPAGRLVNRGADLGAPFSGSAPDLGCFETPE